MATARPNLRSHLVVSAAGGAVVNGLVQLLFALYIVRGFRIDWMVFGGHRTVEQGFVLEDALFTGLSVGAIAGLIAILLAYHAFDRGKLRVAADERWDGPPQGRDAHALILSSALAAGMGLLLLVTAAILFSATRLEFLGASTFILLKGVMGALAGAVASWFGTGITARALASGRVKHLPERNVLAAVALASARKPGAVLGIILIVTAIAAVGASEVDTNVDVADVMPRGDPNTDSAQNLTEKFKSTFTQQVTFQFRISPEKWEQDNARLPNRRTTPDAENITDEVYLRAIDEATAFIKSYPGSPFTGSIAAPDFYSLINWTMEGGKDAPPESFALPGTDSASSARFATVEQGVRRTIVFSSVDAVTSPDWKQTAVIVNVDPDEEMSGKEIGEWALKVRAEYVKWAEENPSRAYQVFTGEDAPLFSVDLPLANAHSSELAAKDFKLLLPVISAWILVALFIAFRSPSAIAISFASLVVSVIWTFGVMGFLDIPLSTLNLTVIPLIMGVGIDYGIHIINEYQEHRAHGLTLEAILLKAGGRGFLALFVATLNTVVGLLVMVVSPSLLIAQLGILSAVAITSSYVLTITLMPALLALAGRRASVRRYRPSPLMGGIARVVGRHRVIVLAVVLGLSMAAFVSSQALTREEFGDPPRNWLPEDSLRQEHETALRGFYAVDDPNVKANVLIFEGDIYDPDAHRYMDAIEASLRDTTKRPAIHGDTLRTLPFLVRTYMTVRNGVEGAGQFILLERLAGTGQLQGQEPYPRSAEEIEALMNEVHETPLKPFANLFYDYPANDMAIMTFSAEAASFEEAEAVWKQVWSAVEENEELRPEGLKVAFFGNTAINYLFIAKELPWLGYMSIVTNVLVVALVYIPTRQWRPTLVVGILNFVTSILWLGLLPILGIGLAITLALPLVFIYAIGSDYGLHLVLSTEATKDPADTYRTTGKAILVSAITTFGAFLIYTQISNLAVRRTMIATSAAIVVIFVTTMLIVPLLYPPARKKDNEGPAPVAAAASEPPGAAPRVTVVEARPDER